MAASSKRSGKGGGGAQGARGGKGGKATAKQDADSKRPTAAKPAPRPPDSMALKIAWWSVLALVFVVPIAISNLTFIDISGWRPFGQLPLTYDQFDIAKIITMRAFTLIAAAAWAWHILVQGGEVRFVKQGGEKPFRFFTWFEFLVLAMLVWLAITTITSIHPPTALFGKYRRFEGLVSFTNYVAVFFLVVQLANRPSRIRTLLKTLFLSSLIVSGYAIIQYIGSVSMLVARNAQLAGALLALAAGVGAGVVWFTVSEERRGEWVWVLAVLALLGLTGAAITASAIGIAQAEAATVVRFDLIRWGTLPFEENRGFSTFGNPDLLGGFLMFPLTISIALALSEKDWRWRSLYWIGFLMTVVAWFTAYVRGAWIGGAAALLAFVVAVVMSGIRARKVDWTFAGLSVAVITAVTYRSLQNPHGVLNIGSRLASIFKTDEGSALTRLQIWQAALASTLDRPLQGFGLDTFRLVFPMYKPYEYVAAAGYLSVADNVHNYPLQLSSGVGIVGAVLVYSAFLVAAWIALPAAFKKGGGEGRLLQAGIWAACFGYVTHLFFGLSVTGSTVFMWVCMGLLLAPLAKPVAVAARSWGVYAGAAAVALCALLFAGNIVYAVADSYYLKGRIASGGTGRVDAIETAIRLNPTNDMYRSELGLAYQDIAVNTVFEVRNAQQAGQDTTGLQEQAVSALQSAERSMQSAIEFAPTEYDNYVFIANLYNFAADYVDPSYRDKAIEWARKGVTVEKYGPAIRYQLAIALTGNDEPDEALMVLRSCVQMDPNYAESWALMGDIYRQNGQPANALAMYLKGQNAKPTDEQIKSILEQVIGELLSLGHRDLVIEHLTPYAVREYPNLWASLRLGQLMIEDGRVDEAADVYRKALDAEYSDSQDPATYSLLQQALTALEGGAPIAVPTPTPVPAP